MRNTESTRSKTPAVSIVIPTHNRLDFLIEAIDSVIAQSFQDFELIVVDDDSTDDTAEMVKKRFAGRVQYFRQKERSGPGAARNRGILEACGKYVAFLDSDDLWTSNKLERQVAYMDSHPEVVMTFTDFSRSDHPELKPVSALQKSEDVCSGDVFIPLLNENFIVTPSVMIRRELFAVTGLFETNLFGKEDFEFWLRVAQSGSVDYINEVLSLVREHENRITRTIAFWRDNVRAVQLVQSRWSSDPKLASLLRKKLGKTYFELGYQERIAGRYREAAAAFKGSFRYGEQRLASLLRIIVFGMAPLQLINVLWPRNTRNP